MILDFFGNPYDFFIIYCKYHIFISKILESRKKYHFRALRTKLHKLIVFYFV
jgi:hypothetical protein